MTIVTGLSDSRNLDVIFVYFECCIRVRCYYDTIFFITYSVTPRTTPLERWRCGGASGDGFEAPENSINFLGQSILFHNLLSFTL